MLDAVDLPHDGVAEYLDGFLVARNSLGQVVGCVGMERHGRLGLLLSAAVTPELQRSGLGAKLTKAILQEAARQGLSDVLLLTTTASDFFAKKFGFTSVDRGGYDERLASSPEWRLPRCSSAVLMKVEIDPPASTP
ncbi:MAG TPA: GNAT family N-acetyltransferase [Blastocatellia bacterium]|nr:GNAT family N-acetyltransferase [Blastocatellia bacterium]